MPSDPTRRDALKQIGAAGASLAFAGVLRGQSGDLVIGGKPVEIVVSSVSPTTVRITVLPIADGKPAAVPVDGALVQNEWGRALARARSAPPLPSVRAGNLTVRLTESPTVLHVEDGGRTIQRLTFPALDDPATETDITRSLSFLLPNGPLLGLGEGGPQFDRKGSTDRMRSGQGGYQLRTHGGRVPIQWLVGTDGWGMYLHQPLGSFNFTGAEGRFTPLTTPAPPAGASLVNAPQAVVAPDLLPLDVFIVSSPDPAAIIGEYARITGRAEMPALWTFGYQQSHRTLAGRDQILSIARTFREKKLPCDALIYLGTEFTPSGWNTRNGEFAWHPTNFPNPKPMIDELHDQHFKVVLHIVVEGRRFTGAVSDPCTADPIPPGRTADNRWPPERQVSCYWPAHKPLYDLGVDGWWPDQGDGYDAASRLARIRMYWEGSQTWRPNERPYALHRNGYAGMQRYGAFLWSGDVYTTWETLQTHVPVAVNTALSGIPFWGTDIGGFVPTREYTGELHVRWFQFGAFNPLFRAHGRNWHLRLPWGWNLGTIGVSEIRNYTGGAADPDPSELNNPHVEPILKKYLELRYRLMPYLYSAVRECAQTGLPIIRAMWLHYPDDAAAVARGDQYLWGRDILVAPVVEKGATSRRLYLPRGVWYDFWTSERVEGGREIDRAVDLETMPLYVRAGAIVPMGPVRQYTSEPVEGPLTLTVHPGADGSFQLYEDDGMTFDYRQGEWMGIAMRWQDAQRRLTLQLAPGSRMLPPARRAIEIRVAGSPATRSVTFAGQTLQIDL
jgi:alpha-glucosidase/alpha-D-xyloside xylohydrolase